jgi:hypothetical protein
LSNRLNLRQNALARSVHSEAFMKRHAILFALAAIALAVPALLIP